MFHHDVIRQLSSLLCVCIMLFPFGIFFRKKLKSWWCHRMSNDWIKDGIDQHGFFMPIKKAVPFTYDCYKISRHQCSIFSMKKTELPLIPVKQRQVLEIDFLFSRDKLHNLLWLLDWQAVIWQHTCAFSHYKWSMERKYLHWTTLIFCKCRQLFMILSKTLMLVHNFQLRHNKRVQACKFIKRWC